HSPPTPSPRDPADRRLHAAHAHFSFQHYPANRHLHSFPTRRSSDLLLPTVRSWPARPRRSPPSWSSDARRRHRTSIPSSCSNSRDRKSTRLNSSHVAISYAVFCLKKKSKTIKADSKNFNAQPPSALL